MAFGPPRPTPRLEAGPPRRGQALGAALVPGIPDVYGDVGRHPDYEQVPGLLVLRLEAPLFYANAAPVCSAIKRLVGASDPLPRAVILDFGANSDLDITSSETLEDLVKALRSAGIDFGLAEVRAAVAATGRRTGVLATIGAERVFHTIDEGVDALGVADDRGPGETASEPG